MKNRFISILFIMLFISMIILPKSVFIGAQKGLLLWFNTVLPTLLPFMILSNLMVESGTITYIANVLYPLIGKFFAVSRYGTYAVLAGFLCGYPMGAKVTSDLLRKEYISANEGQYLLSFCNNTSPAFILNYVLWQNLHVEGSVLPYVVILIGAPVLCSFLFRSFLFRSYSYVMTSSEKKLILGSQETILQGPFGTQQPLLQLLDYCMMNAFESIVKVGAYIMIFSVFIETSQAIITMPAIITTSVAITNFLLASLEFTTGIAILCGSQLSAATCQIAVLALTSFGGWCSLAQTSSMIQGTSLKTSPYIIEKLITALVTSFFAYLYLSL